MNTRIAIINPTICNILIGICPVYIGALFFLEDGNVIKFLAFTIFCVSGSLFLVNALISVIRFGVLKHPYQISEERKFGIKAQAVFRVFRYVIFIVSPIYMVAIWFLKDGHYLEIITGTIFWGTWVLGIYSLLARDLFLALRSSKKIELETQR